MSRATFFPMMLCVAAFSFAGFEPKVVKPKPPQKFQTRTTASGITIASDLLLGDKAQTEFFYKALTPQKVIALRLAIFNESSAEVLIPIEAIRLFGPDGNELPSITPEAVAQAVLQGMPADTSPKPQDRPVQIGARNPGIDRRTDRTDPNYDPRLDPSDPRYDPNDPRNRGYGGRRSVPNIGVILRSPVPGGSTGGGGASQDEIRRSLIAKDFTDKAYSPDPILPSMSRDRFLYFSLEDPPAGVKGFELRVTEGKGLSQGVSLKF